MWSWLKFQFIFNNLLLLPGSGNVLAHYVGWTQPIKKWKFCKRKAILICYYPIMNKIIIVLCANGVGTSWLKFQFIFSNLLGFCRLALATCLLVMLAGTALGWPMGARVVSQIPRKFQALEVVDSTNVKTLIRERVAPAKLMWSGILTEISWLVKFVNNATKNPR